MLCGQNERCLNITARASCDLVTTVLCRVKENHDNVVSLKWTTNCGARGLNLCFFCYCLGMNINVKQYCVGPVAQSA